MTSIALFLRTIISDQVPVDNNPFTNSVEFVRPLSRCPSMMIVLFSGLFRARSGSRLLSRFVLRHRHTADSGEENRNDRFPSSSLLLKIPEEQAIVLLCRLMEDRRYSLRELYKTHFENLQLKFYQLTRLIDELLPELSQHFSDLNIQSHMFASQWFFTLFTAKFPLYLVFRIIDLFLFDVR